MSSDTLPMKWLSPSCDVIATLALCPQPLLLTLVSYDKKVFIVDFVSFYFTLKFLCIQNFFQL